MLNRWCIALALAALFTALPHPLWAQDADSAVVEDAVEAAPPPSAQHDLDSEATGAGLSEAEKTEKLNLTISLDLIDLDRLRQAIEQQAPHTRVQMSLDECVRLAVANNQDVLVAEFEPLKSFGDILAAKGEFDPILSSTATYLNAAQSTASDIRTFGGVAFIKNFRTTGQTALAGKLVTGTQYTLSFDANKEETTFNDFIEEWEGRLTLSLSQPLLRGFGTGVNKARIRIARNSEEAANEQLRLTLMTTVGEVVKAYWDLVGAIEQLRVREESLANAERLLDVNEKRFSIGTAAAIDVLQAKAGVATRQSDLIAARSAVADREDFLKKLLSMRDGDFLSAVRIAPTDRPQVEDLSPEALAALRPSIEASMEKAVEHRPEIAIARLDVESAKLQLRQSKNEMLPQVDLGASASSGGRDHYASEMLSNVADRKDYAYTVSVTGSIPIGNRAARGAYHRANETVAQAEQRSQKALEDVMLDVSLSARAVTTSQILVESNRQARILQEANVIAEEKRLELGVTTSYRVLQVQEDLTAAQTQEVQAKVNYHKALTDLQVAEGVILNEFGIEFAPPSDEPVSFLKSVTPFVEK